MTPDAFAVGPMTRDELDVTLAAAAREGWNPGLRDADAFWAADPAGFLAGRLNGRMIASLSAVAYGANFRFIGLYIVDPAHRGRGIGRKLWNEALSRFGIVDAGLDAVTAKAADYERSGFARAYTSNRLRGLGGGEAGPGLIDLASVAFAAITAYDAAVFGFDRAPFLKPWIAAKGVVALGIPKPNVGTDGLAGYGVLRPCRDGWKIGPLFADDAKGAEGILRGLLAAAPGEAVFLDVPDPTGRHASWAALLAGRFGMTSAFETVRMYKGAPPAVDLGRVFGVTSFELG